MNVPPDRRPVLVAVAGSNGAGKTTFCQAHLRPAGLRIVNADVLAEAFGVDAYKAAGLAEALRWKLLESRESFAFETVFSDPAGAKLGFLEDAAAAGYAVTLCFIGISTPAVSEERVAMRVSQGGHDVPAGKIEARFPRTLANLKAALVKVPCVRIFDNDDLRTPFRKVAVFEKGRCVATSGPIPPWLAPLLP